MSVAAALARRRTEARAIAAIAAGCAEESAQVALTAAAEAAWDHKRTANHGRRGGLSEQAFRDHQSAEAGRASAPLDAEADVRERFRYIIYSFDFSSI